mmetsp:Transcript_17200/g.32565  ORF Transcript_17200/g.32565 Transcript_17200/m.32565 type:complete len:202 (+) Transcript_17200:349-954(+)
MMLQPCQSFRKGIRWIDYADYVNDNNILINMYPFLKSKPPNVHMSCTICGADIISHLIIDDRLSPNIGDGSVCGKPNSSMTVRTYFIFFPVSTSCTNSPSPEEDATIGCNLATYMTRYKFPKKMRLPPNERRINIPGAMDTSQMPLTRKGSWRIGNFFSNSSICRGVCSDVGNSILFSRRQYHIPSSAVRIKLFKQRLTAS